MNKKKLVGIVSIIIVLSILVGVGIFVLSEHKTSQIKDKLDLGEKYLEELEYEKALAYFMEVLEIDPKNVDAYIGIVDTYVAMGDYEKALEYAKRGYEETGEVKLQEKLKEVFECREITKGSSEELLIQGDYVIEWIDSNLEKRMREVTQIYDRDILYSDVKDITNLDLSMGWETADTDKIKNISALSNMKNLKYLNLDRNIVSDISNLSALTNLETLYLDNNNITDINSISELIKLEDLVLSRNNIIDISALKDLINIDISVLEGLANLTTLSLGYNREISDFSVLGKLTNLRELTLRHNMIGDISMLGSLTNLTYLDLYSNGIKDISILGNLTQLTYLDLGFNSMIDDISILENLTNLTSLSLYFTGISDINVLENLGSLSWLELGATNISDISVLANLTNLQTLGLQDTAIDDYSSVSFVSDLRY